MFVKIEIILYVARQKSSVHGSKQLFRLDFHPHPQQRSDSSFIGDQEIRTMADALGLYIKQAIQHYVTFNLSCGQKALDSKRMMTEAFDGLMNHLRDMMAGYENEDVLGLLKEMEGLVASEAWYAHIGDRQALRIKHVNEAWSSDLKTRSDKMLVACEQLCNIRYNSDVEKEEAVVGFDEEVEILLDQLTGSTSIKQLQIISITGMAGLGKTTLARTLYSHDLVKNMFDFRLWTTVSPVYQIKGLLLNILSSFIDDYTDEYCEMSDQELGEKLYRKLKGRKYLVVLDDIWDYRVCNNLKVYFPDDNTGSRVIITSREIDVSLHVESARPAHVLRFRTEVESWNIFEKKVFRMGICPGGLEETGRVINRKCEGLPLAIVIASGLLKSNLSITWWGQIAASVCSFMVSDPNQYMHSLALSYDHLPPHLKPCFLFLGAFPEDYEVPVTKLIWLWISQGLIHETGSLMLEDVAEGFVMDLIKRSLLMTSRIKSDSQVKTCRIHDLLRHFCFTKAEEENFLSNNFRYGMLSSMPCFPLELGKSLQKAAVHMVNLRYLAIQAHDGSPHALISNLVNLQMLIISSRKNIVVPNTLWNMVNLRHLYIKSGENLIEEPIFEQVAENDGYYHHPNALASFQTLSQVSPRSCHNIFSRTPNLRKLGFCGPLVSRVGDLEFPNLGTLVHLQKLKLLNTLPHVEATRSCNPIMFPEKLKKLTLSNTGIDWKEMWTFAWLPSLEVLNLKFQACIGEIWETGDAEFRRLKVLKLHDLEIKQWDCSRDNFPRLQRLVIHRCIELESVPMALGKSFALEVIEVNGCSLSAYSTAVELQKEQESVGNNILKVHGKENS
ncbi:putative late blight resistance protein homolog R1B-16 isoform X2 [Bidens hawaiensis]|uniref:putative late blight resistance protein homolog R1B-16 isoform X2 n=1 Tax=Bidens hawaiensis TaxID=980011 RepID=UPI0040496803